MTAVWQSELDRYFRYACERSDDEFCICRPKPFFEYFVSVLPQSAIEHQAHLPDGSVETIASPPDTETFQHVQTSYDSQNPVDLDSYGPTKVVPLGYVVHARSGDKGSDANVGFYVRHDDEWPWLRDL